MITTLVAERGIIWGGDVPSPIGVFSVRGSIPFPEIYYFKFLLK